MIRWGVYAEDAAVHRCLKDLQQADAQTTFLIVRHGAVVDELAHGLSRTEFCESWEQLLVAKDLTAIMVQGVTAETGSIVRQLSQRDCPLYVWPAAEHGLSMAYELSLMADERTAPIIPFWPFQGDQLLAGLRADLGRPNCRVTHVELQRTGPTATTDDPQLDQLVADLRQTDLALLQWMGVRARRITALDSSRPQQGHRRLTITLDGVADGNGLWACELSAGLVPKLVLNVQSTIGNYQLSQDAAGLWQHTSAATTGITPQGPVWLDPESSWNQAVEVFEWIDAVERSLKRRRTIELHNEPLSERAIFKSQMVAGGCGVLTATFALALVYLAVGETIPLPTWALKGLRLLVFAPLFLFLAAQLLLPLTRPAQKVNPTK
ncbi:hypothetical protein GC163_01420 [bacterium]|nr:hypothetical protein [bacterium]